MHTNMQGAQSFVQCALQNLPSLTMEGYIFCCVVLTAVFFMAIAAKDWQSNAPCI